MNYIYVKLISGDLLKVSTTHSLRTDALSIELMDKFEESFKTANRFSFHFFRRIQTNEEINYVEVKKDEYILIGETVDLIVNLPSHILVYCNREYDIPWYKEIDGNKEGPLDDLYHYFTEDEMFQMCVPECVETPQIIVDYDSLRYHFEPKGAPEWVFSNESVLYHLNFSFNPPSLDDYLQAYPFKNVYDL